MMERAFDGFLALPPPDDCWKILGLPDDMLSRHRDVIMDAFRNQARKTHGNGGDMARLVKARDEALEKSFG
jgi:hypothetical protein